MKKFTLLATAALALTSFTANAELMDKPFYRMTNFTAFQDASQVSINAPATGTNPITVTTLNKGKQRWMSNTWGETAYAKCPAVLPETGYSFVTYFTASVNDTTANTLEFILLPVDSPDAGKYSHMKLFPTTDYFFRFHQAARTMPGTVDVTYYVNGDVQNNANWNQGETEGTPVTLKLGVKYEIRVNVVGDEAKYEFNDVEGKTTVASGTRDISALSNKHIGELWFNPNAPATYTFDNVSLSYLANGPFANDPTTNLLAVVGKERDYYVQFNEGEKLHWILPGQTEEAEGSGIAYKDANDDRNFEPNDKLKGCKIIECYESGTLKLWTSRIGDDSNVSDINEEVVVCEDVTMPTPSAYISNVSEGFGKEYTLTVDNSQTLLTPIVTIGGVIKDKSGNTVKTIKAKSGDKVEFTEAGSMELYAYDNEHDGDLWYLNSETVTITNDVEYTEVKKRDYAVSFADAATLGLTEVKRLVDLKETNGVIQAQSHWERIYSEEKRGYKADGSSEAYTADNAADYTWVKEGFGVIAASEFTSGECGWNIYCPSTDQIQSAFDPLYPSEANPADYAENGWAIFPLEGIVYDNISNCVKKNPAGAAGYLEMEVYPGYVSDDASKPNFYIINKVGGYDRPDKGDCTSSEVIVCGEKFWLYRFDTAIRNVRVMAYKGFTVGVEAISANKQNASEAIYNLSGIRVKSATSGLYVKGGKVILVK